MPLSGQRGLILAYAALEELWHEYDEGGISMGRSLRAYLLELIRALMAPKQRPRYRCPWFISWFSRNYRTLASEPHESEQYPMLRGLRCVSGATLVYLLLLRLRSVYSQAYLREAEWEVGLVKVALAGLVPTEDYRRLRRVTNRCLITEAQRRVRLIQRERIRLHGQAMAAVTQEYWLNG